MGVFLEGSQKSILRLCYRTNQFGIPEDVEYFQEVTDSRFMAVCFVEPIFSNGNPFLKHFSFGAATTASTPEEAVASENGDAAAETAPDTAAKTV